MRYIDWSRRSSLDTSAARLVTEPLEAATSYCRMLPLEGSAWYLLANAHFYAGHWSQAAHAYRRSAAFPEYAVDSITGVTQRVLTVCAADPALHRFRVAAVSELVSNPRAALQAYQSAAREARCGQLRTYAQHEWARVAGALGQR